ncbi:sulfate transport system permease protein [Stella humosa]|uniref:Sulfate transport system permease protein n=1 Tax=Stella humosa TaxID=94 RepID=A0A3N1MDH6_9PROT|nr:sulfate ABC transporter permease subunit CysW [Stella humosa]ROQ01773.1 sulfate transport system permease protein [Stella humosa]BBK32157.1 sulfate ABC transporter permease subunit CysW [Stella humosa]
MPAAARGGPGRETGAARRPSGAGAWFLVALGAGLTLLLVAMPLVLIFAQALRRGWGAYLTAVAEPDTLSAIGLTVLVVLVTVPLNMLFGLAAAWALAKFRFRGKRLLTTLIELPFSVSPIVAGVIYVLLYGAQGYLGPWLAEWDIRIIFSIPGIILVTMFVTSPLVVREILPLMQAQGTDEEESAHILGASAWQMFRRVTLPNIKWALLYGTILCTARAVGEFGSVSVVSGNVRGETNTLPLQIELLYNDYNAVGAFAAATILAMLSLVTLVVKAIVERRAAAAR